MKSLLFKTKQSKLRDYGFLVSLFLFLKNFFASEAGNCDQTGTQQ
jgi:hypothetical protein